MAEERRTARSVARGFLFADLRGYSAFVEQHGDRAGAELLKTYRDLVRATIAEFEGAEIRTEGDSFFIVFDSPSAAVECGLEILERAATAATVSGHRLSLGIGVHAGETVATDEGFVGSAVNIAARICGAAAANELLVSDAVRSITRTYLDVGFLPAGRKRLKGIPEPMNLYRVVASRAAALSPPATLDRLTPRRAVAAALVALVALATVLVVVAAQLIPGRPEAASEATGSSTASGEPPATAAPPPDATDSFPNAAETALRDRIDETLRRRCGRAEPEDVPMLDYAGVETTYSGPMVVAAGLRCALGSVGEPDVAWFWQPTASWAADEYFFSVVGERSIPAGDCATQDRAHQRWDYVGNTGDLLCIVGSRDAQIIWTYEDERVIGVAVRGDGDVRTLYRWWLDHARTLLPVDS